jgi:myo-inositol-1(or 4)-monophosphatase
VTADDFGAVEAFLREIGAFQLEGFRKLRSSDIQVKEGGSHGLSVVTGYDVETETRTARFIEERFPGDSFLGEETGNVRRDPGRYWILDPIDGTSNYTQGVVYWGPSLCFWDDSGPKAGWIYMPAVDELFHARRGEGAWLNGRPIRSSKVTEYSDLCTVATTSRLHRKMKLTAPAKHRILGSVVVNLAYVASGRFAASYSRAHVWDLAAGILIAAEAGAVVDCSPAIDALRPAEMVPGSVPAITVHARANRDLPSLESHLVPAG